MPSISTSRVEVLPDHLERVLELQQAAHRQVLALDRDDHLVRGGERVDRQQPEARRRVDADEVVVVARPPRAPSRASARGRSGSTSRSRRRRGRSRRRRCRSRARWITSRIGMWWTSTSYIDFSTLSGSIPWLIVRLPCGSRSTQSTSWPDSAKATARLRVVVVFATPPFWLAKRDHLGASVGLLVGARSPGVGGRAARRERLAGGDPQLLVVARLGTGRPAPAFGGGTARALARPRLGGLGLARRRARLGLGSATGSGRRSRGSARSRARGSLGGLLGRGRRRRGSGSASARARLGRARRGSALAGVVAGRRPAAVVSSERIRG